MCHHSGRGPTPASALAQRVLEIPTLELIQSPTESSISVVQWLLFFSVLVALRIGMLITTETLVFLRGWLFSCRCDAWHYLVSRGVQIFELFKWHEDHIFISCTYNRTLVFQGISIDSFRQSVALATSRADARHVDHISLPIFPAIYNISFMGVVERVTLEFRRMSYLWIELTWNCTMLTHIREYMQLNGLHWAAFIEISFWKKITSSFNVFPIIYPIFIPWTCTWDITPLRRCGRLFYLH